MGGSNNSAKALPPGIASLSFYKIRPLSEQNPLIRAFAPSNNST
jgi:hypothetical protein